MGRKNKPWHQSYKKMKRNIAPASDWQTEKIIRKEEKNPDAVKVYNLFEMEDEE